MATMFIKIIDQIYWFLIQIIKKIFSDTEEEAWSCWVSWQTDPDRDPYAELRCMDWFWLRPIVMPTRSEAGVHVCVHSPDLAKVSVDVQDYTSKGCNDRTLQSWPCPLTGSKTRENWSCLSSTEALWWEGPSSHLGNTTELTLFTEKTQSYQGELALIG